MKIIKQYCECWKIVHCFVQYLDRFCLSTNEAFQKCFCTYSIQILVSNANQNVRRSTKMAPRQSTRSYLHTSDVYFCTKKCISTLLYDWYQYFIIHHVTIIFMISFCKLHSNWLLKFTYYVQHVPYVLLSLTSQTLQYLHTHTTLRNYQYIAQP